MSLVSIYCGQFPFVYIIKYKIFNLLQKLFSFVYVLLRSVYFKLFKMMTKVRTGNLRLKFYSWTSIDTQTEKKISGSGKPRLIPTNCCPKIRINVYWKLQSFLKAPEFQTTQIRPVMNVNGYQLQVADLNCVEYQIKTTGRNIFSDGGLVDSNTAGLYSDWLKTDWFWLGKDSWWINQ